MPSLDRLLALGRIPRVVGFDDAPFDKERDAVIEVAGAVCAGTRLEGLLWGRAARDGDDATAVLAGMLLDSKFADQVHLVLVDGLAIGGLNLVDLPELAARVDRPCLAVMRRLPDLAALDAVVARFPDAERRRALITRAGPIHTLGPAPFQVAGASPEVAAAALARLTDRGHVPEALRLAHLIGSAVKRGESGRRA